MPSLPAQPAEYFDTRMPDWRARFPVVLLGGGPDASLPLRTTLAARLRKLGYQAHLMEEFKSIPGESIKKKWPRFLKSLNPEGFVVLLRANTDPGTSLPYEIGNLRGRIEAGASARIHIMVEDGLKGSELGAYLGDELSESGSTYYGDENQLVRRTARAIDNMIVEREAARASTHSAT